MFWVGGRLTDHDHGARPLVGNAGISQARGALNALAALLPDTAERIKASDTEFCSTL